MNTEKAGEERISMPPPIRSNDITSAYEPISKEMWKKDNEEFMGEDYEPIFTNETEPTRPSYT
jgi:hypothetical protein